MHFSAHLCAGAQFFFPSVHHCIPFQANPFPVSSFVFFFTPLRPDPPPTYICSSSYNVRSARPPQLGAGQPCTAASRASLFHTAALAPGIPPLHSHFIPSLALATACVPSPPLQARSSPNRLLVSPHPIPPASLPC